MGWVKKSITGKDIFEAIVQDGFGHLRGKWFFKSADQVVSACLFGQAAINLGVYAYSEQTAYHSTKMGLNEALNEHEVAGDTKWNSSYYARGIADCIIANYDQMDSDTGLYTLSWEESVEMARDLLTPVWATIFTVDAFDYSTWDYISAQEKEDMEEVDDVYDEAYDGYY